jgi:hypothetical protein
MYQRIAACSIVTLMITIALPGAADGAKAKKQESEVQKALKAAYPDAETSVTGTTEVNGVKVYDIAVKTKSGQSTAQITDYGDFLMHGVPHEYGAIKSAIQQDVSGLFQAAPQDIEMYRVTNYFVEFKGAKDKNYVARFDAVGRLLDIANAEEWKRESGEAARGGQVKDAEAVKKATQYVKRESPEAEVESVYQAPQQGQDFWSVQLKGGGEVVVNQAGQIYSLRQPITKEDFPEPVADSIKKVFKAPIASLSRGQYEYYQFNQQSQAGTPIVVKMRPNGDILEVINSEAIEQEKAQQAKSKQKG